MPSAKVMFVDDEEFITTPVKFELQQIGYDVDIFSCSDSALDAFRLTPDQYAIAIIDYYMPDMDGVELALALKKIKFSLPVLICSGSMENCKEALQNAGLRYFMAKPYDIAQLDSKIKAMLAGEK